jgi:hypothetical protein
MRITAEAHVAPMLAPRRSVTIVTQVAWNDAGRGWREREKPWTDTVDSRMDNRRTGS